MDENIMAMDLEPKLEGWRDRVDSLSTGPHPDRTRYFRAILTDAQVEVLEKACARFLDDDADWLANPPTDADVEQLASAMAALQTAEVIVP